LNQQINKREQQVVPSLMALEKGLKLAPKLNWGSEQLHGG